MHCALYVFYKAIKDDHNYNNNVLMITTYAHRC